MHEIIIRPPTKTPWSVSCKRSARALLTISIISSDLSQRGLCCYGFAPQASGQRNIGDEMKMLDGKITPRLCLSDSPQDGQDPGCFVSSYWAPLCPMLGRSGVPPLCPIVCRQVRSSVPGCPIVCRQVAAQGAVARCTALTSHSHTGRLCHLVQVERRRRKVERRSHLEVKTTCGQLNAIAS